MNKILTLTIPSYNMEKYIENCLNSFIDERVMNAIEVIVVNDGSKDNTLKIAKTYEEKYPETFIVIDKENGGHGSTINKGIELAKGKYFKVIDSDDWVDTEEFVKFVEFLKTIEADYIITNYTEQYEDTLECVEQKVVNRLVRDAIVAVDDILQESSGMIPMHSVTYKTEILQNNKIRLFEKCFYVDVQYNLFPVEYISSCICKSYNVYQYRLGRAGQSVSGEGFLKHIYDHRRVVISTLDYCKNFIDKNSIKYEYAVRIMKSLVNFNLEYVIKYGHNKKDIVASSAEFYQRIQKEYPEFTFNFGRIRNILWKNKLKGLKLYVLANKILGR